MREKSNYSSYRGQFFSNVGCTILIHVLMTVLGALGVILGSTFQDFAFIAIFFVLAVIGYPLFGYLVLRVLPKNNLLSVFILTLLLAVASIILIIVSVPSDSALGLLSFANFPAYMITTMLIGFDGIIDFAHAEYLAFFVAAFIPSPLMYLGLRLRMHRESRQASAA
ncbi:MAG: hypothetical protein FWC81_01115 [Coriobacteriia bacterium]|nr:hypothetical protein [Coriobacteriia bacterium]